MRARNVKEGGDRGIQKEPVRVGVVKRVKMEIYLMEYSMDPSFPNPPARPGLLPEDLQRTLR